MKRFALFAVLLVAFLVWTFPHKLLIERALDGRLQKAGLEVEIGAVRPSLWPIGYKLSDLSLSRGAYALSMDSLHVGFGPFSGVRVEADACGGVVKGGEFASEDGDGLELAFRGIDPATCLKLDGIVLRGDFEGSFSVAGLGRNRAKNALGGGAHAGELRIAGTSGVVSGHLPAPSSSKPGQKQREPRPIGEWEFARARLDATLEEGDIVVRSADAEAEGVEWVLAGGRISRRGGTMDVQAELRARKLDDTPRAKAVLALFPRASEKDDGWRTYRISGPVSAPQIIGMR